MRLTWANVLEQLIETLPATATGNQIRGPKGPALRIAAGTAVSAVGNATTAGATITPAGALRPAPYNAFNLVL